MRRDDGVSQVAGILGVWGVGRGALLDNRWSTMSVFITSVFFFSLSRTLILFFNGTNRSRSALRSRLFATDLLCASRPEQLADDDGVLIGFGGSAPEAAAGLSEQPRLLQLSCQRHEVLRRPDHRRRVRFDLVRFRRRDGSVLVFDLWSGVRVSQCAEEGGKGGERGDGQARASRCFRIA